MSRSFGIALAALVVSILPQTALAQTGAEQVSVRVSYADLNLMHPEGGLTLLKRIKKAARYVCPEREAPFKLSASECRRNTIDNAVRRLDVDTLTLAWSGRPEAGDQLALK